MKPLWCWRCKMEIPMLDEKEYAEFSKILSDTKTKPLRLSERFKPALDYYSKLTGFEETNINAVFHHRLALYGPPCENCGKPYRTPQAALCVACGHKRYAQQ